MVYDSSYYDAIRGRLHAVLWEVSDRIPEASRKFATEEIDANELGLALEVIVDNLEEAGARLNPNVVSELKALERTMQMGIDVAGRLAPLIREDAP